MSNTDLRLVKGSKTRENILYSALKIITTEGIKSISASKIAKLCGISKSTVFHHFEKVEDIPFHALEEISKKINNSLKNQVFNSFQEYLDYLEEITFSNSNEDSILFEALFSFYQEAMFSQRYKSAINACSNEFLEITKKELLKHSNLEVKMIDSLSTLIMTTIDGLGIHYLINRDERLRISWKDFSKMIISYI